MSVFAEAPVITLVAILRTVVGFLVSVLSIRLLGAEDFGQFALVAAFGGIFLHAYSGVYTVLVARLVQSRTSATASPERVSANATAGLAVTVPAWLLIAALAWIFAHQMERGEDFHMIIAACAGAYSLQLGSAYSAALIEGMGKVARAAIAPSVGGMLTVAYLAATLVLRGRLALSEFLILINVAYGIEFLIGVITARHLTRRHAGFRLDLDATTSLFREGLNLQAAKVIGYAIEPINKLALQFFLGPATIATYDLASKCAGGMQTIFAAYSRLFLQVPRSDNEARQSALRQAANFSWVPFLLAGSLITLLFIQPFASWLRLGPGHLAVGFYLAALTNWLQVIATPMYFSLIGFGDYPFIVKNQATLAIVGLLGSIFLVPTIGFFGAFVGPLLGTLLNVFQIERRFRSHVLRYESMYSIGRGMAARIVLALFVFTVASLPRAAFKVADEHTMLLGRATAVLVALALLLREPVIVAQVTRMRRRAG